MGKLFSINLVNIEKDDANNICKIITSKLEEKQSNIITKYKNKHFNVIKQEIILLENEWTNINVLIKSYTNSEMFNTFLNKEQQEKFNKKYNLKLQKNYKQDLIDFIKSLVVISKLENINMHYNEEMETDKFFGNYYIAIQYSTSLHGYIPYKYYTKSVKFSDIITKKEYDNITKFFLNSIKRHKDKYL